MRIITGALKGRVVPFDNQAFGNAATTSGRAKEAAFTMMGADLSGLSFLDLFACSGQIGLEAFSRGAEVLMCETERRRYEFIASIIQKWDLGDRIRVHHGSAEKLLLSLSTEGTVFDIIFLDPPYHAQVDDRPLVEKVFSEMDQSTILSNDTTVMVQHVHSVVLPRSGQNLVMVKRKQYGDTVFSAYKPSSKQDLDFIR